MTKPEKTIAVREPFPLFFIYNNPASMISRENR
jgi:hypothetical protein